MTDVTECPYVSNNYGVIMLSKYVSKKASKKVSKRFSTVLGIANITTGRCFRRYVILQGIASNIVR